MWYRIVEILYATADIVLFLVWASEDVARAIAFMEAESSSLLAPVTTELNMGHWTDISFANVRFDNTASWSGLVTLRQLPCWL